MDRSSIWWLVWAGVALVVAELVLYYRMQRKLKPSKRLPPGPKPKPVIGNLGDMDKLSHQKFAKWSGEYGPLVHVRLGSMPFIVANTSKLAREILQTKDKIFSSRTKNTFSKEVSYDSNTLVTAPMGPKWRTIRRIFVGELLTTKRIHENISGVQTDETVTLVKVLLKDCQEGKPAQIGVKLRDHSSNVVTSMMMNKKFFGPHVNQAMDSAQFQSNLKAITRLVGVLHLGDYIPLFKLWDIQGNKKLMRDVHNKMDVFLQEQIDDRRQKLETGEYKQNGSKTDFLDVLLTRSRDNDEYTMTDRHYKGILLNTIFGAVETTAGVIEWTLAELMKNPEKMRKAQEELDNVVGRERLVGESDMQNLPYLSAAIKESLRLHPATPLLLPHLSVEDSTIGGFDIPAKSPVCVNVWAIGRDPQLWENPLEFSPERFLGSPIDSSGRYFEFLPFGSGRRQCPGQRYGLILVQRFVATLIQSFQFTAPPGQTLEGMDMSEITGIVLRKALPLEAILSPRLPQHVINSPATL